jgi:hypothetical protein
MDLARQQSAPDESEVWSAPRRALREEVGFWSAVVAGALVILAVVRLFQWGNRWYIVEQFTKTTEPGESWAWYYELLHSAHGALVTAIVCLLGAAALIAVSWWARRSPR